MKGSPNIKSVESLKLAGSLKHFIGHIGNKEAIMHDEAIVHMMKPS